MAFGCGFWIWLLDVAFGCGFWMWLLDVAMLHAIWLLDAREAGASEVFQNKVCCLQQKCVSVRFEPMTL